MTANVRVLRVGVILIEGNEPPYDLKRSGAAVTLAFDKINGDVFNGSCRIEPGIRSYGPKCDANETPGTPGRSSSTGPIVRQYKAMCDASNKLQAGVGRVGANMLSWGLSKSDSCDCGDEQMADHITLSYSPPLRGQMA